MKPTSIVFTGVAVLLGISAAPAQMSQGSGRTGGELSQTGQTDGAEASRPDPAIVSEVRIVRLSQVRGVVQMDRNNGRGAEAAIANMPIVKGAKLRTGEGVAEVEFEDNSSMRLVPHSAVSFEQLGRTASGSTVTTVSLSEGMAYVSLAKSKDNVFHLVNGESKIAVYPGSSVRFATSQSVAKLAVFQGEAQVDRPGGGNALLKKETLLFDSASDTAPTLMHKTEEEPYDGWDKNQQAYHKGSASFAGSGGSAMYGASDLNYYGQFQNLGGCGSVWRPYFASAAWDPFSNGTWALYPGAGYSWVSPYPWGWLPFHSGSWQQCGASGWGWQPGGQWYGLQNLAVTRVSGRTLHPGTPIVPPTGKATLVFVSTKPVVLSGPTSGESFTFRRDSAGLGVPRESFGKLGSMSNAVERHGGERTTSYTPAFVSPSRTAAYAPASGVSRGSAQGTPGMPSNSRASAPAISSAPSMSSASSMSGASSVSAGSAGGGSHK